MVCTGRREELAVVMCLLYRKFGKKVFVNPTENVAARLLDLLAVE